MNAQQRKNQRLRQKVHQLRVQNKGLAQQASPAFTGGPLSKGQLDQLTKSAVKLKFGGQEQQLQGQIAGSDTRQGQVGDWFGKYKADIAAAKAQSDQANAAARAQVMANLTAAQGSQGATSQKLSDTASGLSKLTGGNFDTGAQTASQANQNTNALSQGHLDALALQLANNATGFGNRQTSASQQEAQAHLGENQRKAGLQTNFGQLKGQEGDYGVTFQNQLRQQDLNNQIAQAAGLVKQQQLDINTQLAGSLIGSRKSTTKHQSTQDALAGKKFSSAEEKDNYLRTHHLGPYKPAKPPKGAGASTPSYRRSMRQKFNEAASLARQEGKDSLVSHGQGPSVDAIVAKLKLPPELALAAYQQVVFGGVGPHTQKTLRRKYKLSLPGFPSPAARAVSSLPSQIGLGGK